jgi:PHP family Zn ribbon phosphoesterase
MSNKQILFAINCKLCKNEFVYCIYAGRDTRCYNCKNKALKDVQKELEEMSDEEYNLFIKDIKEYEDELEEKRTGRMEWKKDS